MMVAKKFFLSRWFFSLGGGIRYIRKSYDDSRVAVEEIDDIIKSAALC